MSASSWRRLGVAHRRKGTGPRSLELRNAAAWRAAYVFLAVAGSGLLRTAGPTVDSPLEERRFAMSRRKTTRCCRLNATTRDP